ncbi:MAG: hypothetical protein L5655_01475 [Thermosediminibacteraceae bacterium]|nr:hypothetical protein [Thermosediminibacteraceae bacterium]
MNSTQGIPETISEYNRKLESFCSQIQSNLTSYVNTLKDLQDNLREVKIFIETSLKELELSLEQNQGMLAKWLASSNTKLQQKQVGQQRLNIIEKIAAVENNLEQFINVLSSQMETVTSSAQELTLGFKDLENKLTNIATQQYEAPLEASLNPMTSVQQTIQQIIETLNGAQENFAKGDFPANNL